MENLIDQLRVKFSALGQDNVPAVAYNSGGRSPRRKIESGKGDDKKEENWFWRHFSLQPSREYGPGYGEDFASVLAAAAFAITSLEEEEHQKQLKMRQERETSLKNNTTRKENGTAMLPISISRRFSGKEGNDMRSPDSLKRSEEEQKMPTVATTQKLQEEASTTTVTTTKQTNQERQKSMKLENIDNITSSSTSLPSADATVSNADDKGKKRSPPSPRSKESTADLRKQTEMKRITDRYEKINYLISSWEDKKKDKAKRHLERRESDLEKKRAKAIRRFRKDLIIIEKISGKERTLAEKRKNKEESKANKEAMQIRLTGKVHASCFCF